jgi:hypothetical protein
MTCPSCGSKNSKEYDKNPCRKQCNDCEWIYQKLISGDYKHEPRMGFAKIIGEKATYKYYGTNGSMSNMVNNNRVYQYKTILASARHGEKRIGYKINTWVWDKDDILIVDRQGNDLTDCEIKYPEPQQFNSKFLDI